MDLVSYIGLDRYKYYALKLYLDDTGHVAMLSFPSSANVKYGTGEKESHAGVQCNRRRRPGRKFTGVKFVSALKII